MSRQDEKKLYEQQEEKILAQSDAFISLLTKRGILADQKIDSEKVRSAKQEKTRNSCYNTLMLDQGIPPQKASPAPPQWFPENIPSSRRWYGTAGGA